MMIETPLTPHIGAEVEGIDLNDDISDADGASLKDALARHHVIFLRDQHIDLEHQKALTQVFGPLSGSSYVEPIEEDPYVVRVLKEADEPGGTFGGDWHTDFSFLPDPPAGSVLSAVEVPPVGGDTLWISQAAV